MLNCLLESNDLSIPASFCFVSGRNTEFSTALAKWEKGGRIINGSGLDAICVSVTIWVVIIEFIRYESCLASCMVLWRRDKLAVSD